MLLALMIVGAHPAWAQGPTKHYLGRPTATEYVFDVPVPADFSEMATATGPKYAAFKQFPKTSSQTINGKTHLFVTTEISWDGDRVDQGTIAFAQRGLVKQGWWFTMDASSPAWSTFAAQLKSQAVTNGNWRSVTMQMLVTQDANQPPLHAPIPEIIQIQKKMDDLVIQARPGMFYSSVQIPANLEALRAQMLAYGNVGRRDPDFRKVNGSKTATDLSGDTVQTLGGSNRVFKQNSTPPYFLDSTLDAKLNQAAQFQAEYNASVNRMSHDGPSTFADPETGKRGSMRDLGARADFFGIPRNVVEAAGGGKARDNPHGWMVSDTHFRPWFGVDGVYPTLGYGAARSASGDWHFVAVATRYADGVMPGNSDASSAPVPAAPAPDPFVAQDTPQETWISLQSYNFPERFIRHRDYKGFIDPIESDLERKDSTFKRVRGLADASHVSLEAANFPGFFLVAEGEDIVLRQRPPNDTQFDRNATFIRHPGLADGSKLSLESYAQRSKYLRHTHFVLYISQTHDSDLFRQDATFTEAAPGCTGAGCQR